MISPNNRVIAGAGFTLCGGLWQSEDFRNNFLPNIGEDQNKSHHLSAGPLRDTVPYYGKSSPSYCIAIIKRLDEGLR